MNTFGIDARAALYGEFEGKEDLDRIFRMLPDQTPWAVLGGGSNILFSGDYPGLILHPVSKKMLTVREEEASALVRADSGIVWDDFVSFCIARGLGGVENLAGIPGLVGASPIQNIGAYGAEAKDTIQEVEVYLPASGAVRTLSHEACGFGYRDSIFKREMKGRAVVLSVTFRLSRKPEFRLDYGDLKATVEELGGPSLENIARAVVAIRNTKLPDPAKLGNSGSFFKNPVVEESLAARLKAAYPDLPLYPAPDGCKLAAGWLIDRAGMKGYRQGNVGVHDRQALVLVNYGGATGSEILSLADKVTGEVFRKFGVELEKEVNVL